MDGVGPKKTVNPASTREDLHRPGRGTGRIRKTSGKKQLPEGERQPPDNDIQEREVARTDIPNKINRRESGYWSDGTQSVSDGEPVVYKAPYQEVLSWAKSIIGEQFNARMFLSGLGKPQEVQVHNLAWQLLRQYEDGDGDTPIHDYLTHLLNDVQDAEKESPEDSMKYGFALRCAILLASELSGAGIPSWKVYTHKQPENTSFWRWIEQPSSWVPEAQAAALKYTEVSLVNAMKLAREHKDDLVVAYKGGFGAGKTSHGKEMFGNDEDGIPLFSGSVGSDSAKNVLRKTLPVSHNTAHVQGSNMAFNLFDGLIRKKAMGTIVYDTSLARSSDIDDLIRKSESAGKSFKVVDIVRDDRARMLAVLSRGVEGEDPRIPQSFLEEGAARDRKQRPQCLNAVLNSTGKKIKNDEGEEKHLQHSYELHCSDRSGSNRKLLVTLTSSKPPQWNPELPEEEINQRLTDQGIVFDEVSGQFKLLVPDEDWAQDIRQELQKPVDELVKQLSEGEAAVRKKIFSERTIEFARPLAEPSPQAVYQSLTPGIKKVISEKAFVDSFNGLNPEIKLKAIASFNRCAEAGAAVSYMELPTAFALEFHRQLTASPNHWPE